MSTQSTVYVPLVDRIRKAIAEELNVTSRGLPFVVLEIHREGGRLCMILEQPKNKHGKLSVLDESLEEGKMIWEGEFSGSAEIISVLPRVSAVNVRLKRFGRPPQKGQTVSIVPPQYLKALLERWQDNELAASFDDWIKSKRCESQVVWKEIIPSSQFPDLRPKQKESFELVRWRASFLWGPPGTGKTRTLGRLLASYLIHHPNDRVLMLSSTNVAVDQAILAVDKGFDDMRLSVRPACYRFGHGFDPEKFRELKHLIPLVDKTLVEKLRRHYKVIPDPADAELYEQWRNQRDLLRKAITDENRGFLLRARLVGMTATLAAHKFSDLDGFDLVVFDEASQIGKAQAATFAHLGTRVLFAGDPMQLAPIAQADSADVKDWLGRSPFVWAFHPARKQATCMLDEQFRMAPQISRAVSTLFYNSELRVAATAESDPVWIEDRKARPTKLIKAPHNLVLVETGARPRAASQFQGYQCDESARLVRALVLDHAQNWQIENLEEDILLLTPYRAQRRKLEGEMMPINFPAKLVSTVHRAQGSERRIVIFDPVCPTADFVRDDEGRRLVNVAMSRAKCRLVVMLQEGWHKNPAFRDLAKENPVLKLNEDDVDSVLLTPFVSARRQ